MIKFRPSIVLAFALLAFAVACDSPTDPSNLPDSATKSDVRFSAVAQPGDQPTAGSLELELRVELLNGATTSRNVTWSGCGIRAQLYRAGSLVHDSHPSGSVCDDYQAIAELEPSATQTRRHSIYVPVSTVPSGRYQVVMLFKGFIDGSRVELSVDAGEIVF